MEQYIDNTFNMANLDGFAENAEVYQSLFYPSP
jgi:hypothetical protein